MTARGPGPPIPPHAPVVCVVTICRTLPCSLALRAKSQVAVTCTGSVVCAAHRSMPRTRDKLCISEPDCASIQAAIVSEAQASSREPFWAALAMAATAWVGRPLGLRQDSEVVLERQQSTNVSAFPATSDTFALPTTGIVRLFLFHCVDFRFCHCVLLGFTRPTRRLPMHHHHHWQSAMR